MVAQAPRLFAVSSSHPLAAFISNPKRNSPDSPQLLDPELLDGQTLISGVSGQKVQEDLALFVKKYNLNLPQPISLQNVNTGIALAQCGMGIGIFPPIYLKNYPAEKDLLYFCVEDPLMQWRMTVRYLSAPLRPIEKRLIELAGEVFQ